MGGSKRNRKSKGNNTGKNVKGAGQGGAPPPKAPSQSPTNAKDKLVENNNNNEEGHVTRVVDVAKKGQGGQAARLEPPKGQNGISGPVSLVLEYPKLEKSQLDDYFEQLFSIPTFQDCLRKHEILDLRLVCHSWTASMDRYFEMFHEEVESDYDAYRSILSSPTTISLVQRRNLYHQSIDLVPNLDDFSLAENFLKETEDFQGNPFISRQAMLQCLGEDKPDRDYWGKVLPILKRFGKELRTLEIYYQSESPTFEMLLRVKECLQRVPYLTNLKVLLYSTHQNDNCPFQILGLPPLPDLERLSVAYARSPVHHPFTVYFDELVTLNIRGDDEFMEWYEPEIHSTFPYLKHLSVLVKSHKALGKVRSITGYLTEVEIYSEIYDHFLYGYFHTIEHFKDSLCSFKVKQEFQCDIPVQSHQDCGVEANDTIELPHLKTLALNLTECGHASLDALRMLTTPPEYLELMVEPCTNPEDHDGKHEMGEDPLGIYEGRWDMYPSKVWEEWPELQEVHVWLGPDHHTIGAEHYTRDWLEHMQKEKQHLGKPSRFIKGATK